MIEISVRVCGDHWLNPQEVREKLASVAGSDHSVVLDMHAEGASITALGIRDTVMSWCKLQRRDPKTVYVKAWPNTVDLVPFQRSDSHVYSHFFWMAQNFWNQPVLPDSNERLFGAFFGRRTPPRMKIMWDLKHHYGDHCLLSLMTGGQLDIKSGVNLESYRDWNLATDWIYDPDIGPIDNNTLQDQYRKECNTNADLLKHYHRFGIEIVAEVYCRGDAYFPTEKTIRPIHGLKPMLIFGPRHFLRRLREQGFKTWHDIWPETYDDLEGLERWSAMQKSMDWILQDPVAMLAAARPVCEHNQQHARLIGTLRAPR